MKGNRYVGGGGESVVQIIPESYHGRDHYLGVELDGRVRNMQCEWKALPHLEDKNSFWTDNSFTSIENVVWLCID